MEKSTDDTKGGEMPLSQGTKEAKPGIYGVLCVWKMRVEVFTGGDKLYGRGRSKCAVGGTAPEQPNWSCWVWIAEK